MYSGDAHNDDDIRTILRERSGGNTNAPTIMIGEKAADMIRAARH